MKIESEVTGPSSAAQERNTTVLLGAFAILLVIAMAIVGIGIASSKSLGREAECRDLTQYVDQQMRLIQKAAACYAFDDASQQITTTWERLDASKIQIPELRSRLDLEASRIKSMREFVQEKLQDGYVIERGVLVSQVEIQRRIDEAERQEREYLEAAAKRKAEREEWERKKAKYDNEVNRRKRPIELVHDDWYLEVGPSFWCESVAGYTVKQPATHRFLIVKVYVRNDGKRRHELPAIKLIDEDDAVYERTDLAKYKEQLDLGLLGPTLNPHDYIRGRVVFEVAHPKGRRFRLLINEGVFATESTTVKLFPLPCKFMN